MTDTISSRSLSSSPALSASSFASSSSNGSSHLDISIESPAIVHTYIKQEENDTHHAIPRGGGKLHEYHSILSRLNLRETEGIQKNVQMLPNVAKKGKAYSRRAYCGVYSPSARLFLAATQAFEVHIYDTSDEEIEHWKDVKTLKASYARWTITDAVFSPDEKYVAYSSISNIVYLASTDPTDIRPPKSLNFDDREEEDWEGNFGIWCLRFSSDGNYLTAGTSSHEIILFDLTANQVVLRVTAHNEDVNAVDYLDISTSTLASAGDDALIRIWDRRCFDQCVAICPGHTDGITSLASSISHNHLISNSKDQTAKIWDLRVATLPPNRANDLLAEIESTRYNWVYMRESYPGTPGEKQLSTDTSLYTLLGHEVTQTLIRAKFAPDGNHCYSGSSGGYLHIWNIHTGDEVSQVPIYSDAEPPTVTFNFGTGFARAYHAAVIRDVSWHPHLPYIACTAWNSGIYGVHWDASLSETPTSKKEQIHRLERIQSYDYDDEESDSEEDHDWQEHGVDEIDDDIDADDFAEMLETYIDDVLEEQETFGIIDEDGNSSDNEARSQTESQVDQE